MKSLIFAASLAALFAGPALGDEAVTATTPQLALPEPESSTAMLPGFVVTETVPMSMPEPEMEAIAPFKRCSGRETVYLTN